MAAPPFLLIDAGNTRLKWATAPVCGPTRVIDDLPTKEVTLHWVHHLADQFSGHQVVLSSVVPKLVPLFLNAFRGRIEVVTGTSTSLGLSFDYPNPAELGADRLAAAVAAKAEEHWPVIIVNCGTATAFTLLDAHGKLCGGAIAPGLQTQLAALIGATAQLPSLDLKPVRDFPGRSTEEAIRAGVLLNFEGGVKEILQRLRESQPDPGAVHVLLTGGNAPHLAKALDLPDALRPLLVFEGLRMIGVRAFIQVL